MPKKDHSTSESNKPIEIKIVIFITDYESSKSFEARQKDARFSIVVCNASILDHLVSVVFFSFYAVQ